MFLQIRFTIEAKANFIIAPGQGLRNSVSEQKS